MIQEDIERHIKILGILNIVAGALAACGGLIILLIFGGIYAAASGASSSTTAEPIIGIIGFILAALILMTSVPSIIAGIGLLHVKPWARILAIIISILQLPSIPFGTALGVYGLWILFSPEGISRFSPNRQWTQP
jgi:hypothetical protein